MLLGLGSGDDHGNLSTLKDYLHPNKRRELALLWKGFKILLCIEYAVDVRFLKVALKINTEIKDVAVTCNNRSCHL